MERLKRVQRQGEKRTKKIKIGKKEMNWKHFLSLKRRKLMADNYYLVGRSVELSGEKEKENFSVPLKKFLNQNVF